MQLYHNKNDMTAYFISDIRYIMQNTGSLSYRFLFLLLPFVKYYKRNNYF